MTCVTRLTAAAGHDKLECMDVWCLIAERKIREAIEEGAFEHLEGTGKPLDLSENPFEDPSDRMANRLLKNNGFAPDWIEEAKEIAAESRRRKKLGACMNGGKAAVSGRIRGRVRWRPEIPRRAMNE